MIQEIMCKCSFNAYQTNSPENSLLNIGGNKDLLFVCLLSKISLNCSHEITIFLVSISMDLGGSRIIKIPKKILKIKVFVPC